MKEGERQRSQGSRKDAQTSLGKGSELKGKKKEELSSQELGKKSWIMRKKKEVRLPNVS